MHHLLGELKAKKKKDKLIVISYHDFYIYNNELFLFEVGRKVIMWEICFITEGRKEMKKGE